ncbi:MAG: hypothetical protein L6R30_15145 [Thermoanaerobaculia bacterium]|nr:hypothetical protein [Thermoanaerobaculia bacterium]
MPANMTAVMAVTAEDALSCYLEGTFEMAPLAVSAIRALFRSGPPGARAGICRMRRAASANQSKGKHGRALVMALSILAVFLAGTAPPFSAPEASIHSCTCCGENCMCGPDASCGCRPHVESGSGSSTVPFVLLPPVPLSPVTVPPPESRSSAGFERAPRIRFLLPGPEVPPPEAGQTFRIV